VRGALKAADEKAPERRSGFHSEVSHLFSRDVQRRLLAVGVLARPNDVSNRIVQGWHNVSASIRKGEIT
jgi:hypothetical protein